jgi:hypothetical protein
MSAGFGFTPREIRKGFSPLRTQNRNPVAPRPMVSVIGFTSGMCWFRVSRISGRVWPWASMPRMCLNWLTAIRMPDAVMKPAMTGWQRKLARKPSFSRPMVSRMPPESTASVSAATA